MIAIDWINKIINVPRAYMSLTQSTPIEIRRLDIDIFRLDLKDIEDSEEGMVYPDTHQHNTAVTVGGVTLARVVEIINDYSLTFEDGTYAVNLVGANSNIADVLNLNQVSVRSANSAGLIDLPAVRLQSYTDARVYIDTLIGSAGTQYPKGTPPDPVDNYTDANTILMALNLVRFNLRGTIFFDVSDSIAGDEIFGASPISAVLVFAGQDTTGATFHQIGITGPANGRASYDTCALGGPFGIADFSGIARECGLNGNITLAASNTENVLFFNCTSIIAGTTKPILDCNGSVGDVHIRGWVGGLKITEFTGGNNMEIDCTTGSLELDSSCTAGTIIVRMNAASASLVDNTAVGCTVVVETITASVSESTIVDALEAYGADTLTNIKPSISI